MTDAAQSAEPTPKTARTTYPCRKPGCHTYGPTRELTPGYWWCSTHYQEEVVAQVQYSLERAAEARALAKEAVEFADMIHSRGSWVKFDFRPSRFLAWAYSVTHHHARKAQFDLSAGQRDLLEDFLRHRATVERSRAADYERQMIADTARSTEESPW